MALSNLSIPGQEWNYVLAMISTMKNAYEAMGGKSTRTLGKSLREQRYRQTIDQTLMDVRKRLRNNVHNDRFVDAAPIRAWEVATENRYSSVKTRHTKHGRSANRSSKPPFPTS